jgi:Alginate lyase
MSFVFVLNDQVLNVKRKLQLNDTYWSKVREELKKKADESLNKGPWSVTFSKSPAASGNPHDYFSEGPYWWPDNENPGGPYIRKDGLRNPNRFVCHRNAIEEMSVTVLYLSSAGYLLDKKEYLDRAVEVLRIWFCDEATKMNPHLEYAQAIRGICNGRSIGIIDTVSLLPAIHALGYIEAYGEYEVAIKKVKDWFKSYLNWLTTSEKGIAEKNHGNNHSNWWNTQVAALAALTNQDIIFEDCCNFYKDVIIPTQIGSNGQFIDEITRTNALSYSFYNLDACVLMCEIAFTKGIDLWNFKTEDGKGIESAVRFLIPYFDNPFLWPYQQLDGTIPEENYGFQMAAIRLNIEECKIINEKRSEGKSLIRDQKPIGPLALLRTIC